MKDDQVKYVKLENSEGVLTKRYFHAWRKREFVYELKKAGFDNIRIIKEKTDNNVIAICIK